MTVLWQQPNPDRYPDWWESRIEGMPDQGTIENPALVIDKSVSDDTFYIRFETYASAISLSRESAEKLRDVLNDWLSNRDS